MKKSVSIILMLALVFSLFAGCGAEKAPDSITIQYDGESVSSLDVLNGTDLSGVTAVVSPEGYSGEITWTSEDFGVIKISSTDGNACTLTAKKTGSTRITASCDGVSVSIWVHVKKNQDMLSEREVALTVHGTDYSAETVTMYFAKIYYDFVDVYGDYASNYGLDISQGIQSLASQSCSYSDDGTWYGYFLEYATAQLEEVQALCDYAAENGITLDDEESEDVRTDYDALTEQAEELGYADLDAYLSDYYGEGITAEMFYVFLADRALAEKVYADYGDSLIFTDEEIASHYAGMGYEEGENDYPVRSMRHILVMAEADENGEYTDEAIAAAHDRAEEIYEEWLDGDRTEDSFAALAVEYSEDTGSVEEGGLYENIYQGEMVDGIDEWLFDESRAEGDTVVVDNNGSYVGTHIVYYVGEGELYSTVLAEDDLRSTALEDWFDALYADYTAEEGPDYSSIGNLVE